MFRLLVKPSSGVSNIEYYVSNIDIRSNKARLNIVAKEGFVVPVYQIY
jgi:hypothetical protein